MENDMSEITMTQQWFVKAGQMPEVPTLDFRQAAFYIGMQTEELAEKLEVVLGGTSELTAALQAEASRFKRGEHDLSLESIMDQETATQLLDADMDLIWVSIGAAAAQGADPVAAYRAVSKANWAKFPNGVVTRDPVTGKVVKPEGWQSPDLAQFIHSSMQGAFNHE